MRWLKNGGRLPRIITYPDYPSKKTTIYKIAKELGFRLSNKPLSTSEAVLFFEDKTTKSNNTHLRYVEYHSPFFSILICIHD